MKLYAKGKASNNNELNDKIIRSAVDQCFIIFIIALMPSLLICGHLVKILQAKAPVTVDFLYLTPEGAVIAAIQVAVFFAIYLSLPFILYRLSRIKFNAARKPLLALVSLIFLLSTLGILFAYYALIPGLLFFLLGLSADLGSTSFSVTSYVDFCIKTIIFSGLVFEFPILLIILAKTDLIKSGRLMKHWKEAAIGALVLSLILTCTELFTFVLFAVIILILYGVVVLTAKLTEKL